MQHGRGLHWFVGPAKARSRASTKLAKLRFCETWDWPSGKTLYLAAGRTKHDAAVRTQAAIDDELHERDRPNTTFWSWSIGSFRLDLDRRDGAQAAIVSWCAGPAVTTRVVVWTVEPKKTRVADGQTTTVYLRAPCMGMVAITVTTGKRFATMRVNESDIAGQKQKKLSRARPWSRTH